MLIKNGKVFIGKSFSHADICFNSKIAAIGSLDGLEDYDAAGCYIVPGFVDIHTHGAVGEDFSDGYPSSVQPLSDYYASNGVTSYLATTMTLPEADLIRAMHAIRDYRYKSGAKCAGIHLEGPFLSFEKRGAQAAENLHAPDIGLFDRLSEASGGQIKIVTIACEEPGAMEFISRTCKETKISLGHTSCTYEQAIEAFSNGASHTTHLFNGMAGLHHRSPGLIAAAMDCGASVELICDGIHVHPAAVRLAHRVFGEKMVLISDSLRCAGMPDGEYALGGQPVTVKDGAAKISGTNIIAGSSISLLDAIRSAVSFGIPLEDTIYAASTAPAQAADLHDIGSIETGKCADFLILDENLNLKAVFVDGKKQVLFPSNTLIK